MTIESVVLDLTSATQQLTDRVNANATIINDRAAQANTKAGEAAASAAQALAVFGTTAAMQSALDTAKTQVAAAASIVASAGAVQQQDLTEVIGATLHRSPNTIAAVLVYDTSKDFDGGAWVERMQHTSWYNEALNGAWLGQFASETAARGDNLLINADMTNPGGAGTSGQPAGWYQGTATAPVSQTASTVYPGEFAYNTVANNDRPYLQQTGAIVETGKTYTFAVTVEAVTGNFAADKVLAFIVTTAAGAMSFPPCPANPAGGVANPIQAGRLLMNFTCSAGGTGAWRCGLGVGSNITGTVRLSRPKVNVGAAETPFVPFSAQVGQYYQNTADGKFYALGATYPAVETFRGNKAKFPRVAGIVAEATSVTIYDLTEKGCPMWMRFRVDISGTVKMIYGSNAFGVAALNGSLYVSTDSATDGAMTELCFASDSAYFTTTNRYRWPATISQRNAPPTVSPGFMGAGFINRQCKAIAVAALPDAPIDQGTGLPVNTVAVQSAGGLNVIKHDGSVSGHSATGSNNDSVAFVAGRLFYTRQGHEHGMRVIRVADVTGSTFAGASFANILFNLPRTSIGIKGDGTLIGVGALPSTASRAANSIANLVRINEVNSQAPLNARINQWFNTGFMAGDIRRAYLSDVGAGSAASTELISNGDFASDTVWTKHASVTISGGAGNFDGVTSLANGTTLLSQPAATKSGRTYTVTYTLTGYAGPGLSLNLGGVIGTARFASGTYTEILTAAADGAALIINTRNNAGTHAGTIDNISVKEVVADRSYKLQSANIVGTLTRTPVASAAQLVGYGGWSAANYAREPYSADLDFGTGEWSISAFVSYTGYAPHNLLTESEFRNGVSDAPTRGTSVTAAAWADAGFTTGLAFPAAGDSQTYAYKTNLTPLASTAYTLSVFVKMDDGLAPVFGNSNSANAANDFALVIANAAYNPLTYTVTPVGGGVYRVALSVTTPGTISSANTGVVKYAANSARGFKVTGYQFNRGLELLPYKATTTAAVATIATIAERGGATGPRITLGYDERAYLALQVSDGTTTRTVTSGGVMNSGVPVKVMGGYRPDGALWLNVNGAIEAQVTGAPLLTMNNAAAVLTMGNSYDLANPFTGGWIANLHLSATAPTRAQCQWTYEREREMYRDGAQVCFPADEVQTDLTYDDVTGKWRAAGPSYETSWTDLVRNTSVAPAAGTFTKVSSQGAIRLVARAGTPVVEVHIPAYALRTELSKRAERIAKIGKPLATFDFDTASFTATLVSGSPSLAASLTNIAGTPYTGLAVSGTGIPAGTTLIWSTAGGAGRFLSANATVSQAGVVVAGCDYTLPPGYTAVNVYANGAKQREGATKAFVRRFDGFQETIRFNVSPGVGSWVQIDAIKDFLV